MFEPTAIYAPNPHRYDTMTYNRAGTSGLKLPAVSLGLLAQLRRHHAIRPDEVPGLHRLRQRHHPLRPGQQLRPRARPGREELRTAARQVLQASPRRTRHLHQGRHEMWTGPYGDLGSRKYLLASLDQSLERLGLDYVDIFYHHHPTPKPRLRRRWARWLRP